MSAAYRLFVTRSQHAGGREIADDLGRVQLPSEEIARMERQSSVVGEEEQRFCAKVDA